MTSTHWKERRERREFSRRLEDYWHGKEPDMPPTSEEEYARQYAKDEIATGCGEAWKDIFYALADDQYWDEDDWQEDDWYDDEPEDYYNEDCEWQDWLADERSARMRHVFREMRNALESVRSGYQAMFDIMPVAWQTYDDLVAAALKEAERVRWMAL